MHDKGRGISHAPAAASKPHNIIKRLKRPLPNVGTFEEILDDDLSYEAKQGHKRFRVDTDQVISLVSPIYVGNLKASWLPPKLRERFSSTLASS